MLWIKFCLMLCNVCNNIIWHILMWCNVMDSMVQPSKPSVALTCPACPRMFASKQGLSHHCTVVHKSPIETLEQDMRCFFFTIILCQLPCTTGDCTDIRFRWKGPPQREKDLHVMMTPGLVCSTTPGSLTEAAETMCGWSTNALLCIT